MNGIGFSGLNSLASDVFGEPERPVGSVGLIPGLENSSLFMKKSNLSSRQRGELAALRVEKIEVSIDGNTLTLDTNELRYGDLCFPISQVVGVRWGKSKVEGPVDVVRYSVHVSCDSAEKLDLVWEVSAEDEEQSALFKRVAFGLNKFLAPVLRKLFQSQLYRNVIVNIGPALITRVGLTLKVNGMFGPKDATCPWARLKSDIYGGSITISDRSNPKFNLTLSLYEVDNAFMLHNLDLS